MFLRVLGGIEGGRIKFLNRVEVVDRVLLGQLEWNDGSVGELGEPQEDFRIAEG